MVEAALLPYTAGDTAQEWNGDLNPVHHNPHPFVTPTGTFTPGPNHNHDHGQLTPTATVTVSPSTVLVLALTATEVVSGDYVNQTVSNVSNADAERHSG